MRGGKRANAGRKKGEASVVVSVRIKEIHAEKLRQLIQEFKMKHN